MHLNALMNTDTKNSSADQLSEDIAHDLSSAGPASIVIAELSVALDAIDDNEITRPMRAVRPE